MGEIMQVFFIDQNVKNNFFKTLFKKIEVEDDFILILHNITGKEIKIAKEIEKILQKNSVNSIVISEKLKENQLFLNYLDSNNFKIVNGETLKEKVLLKILLKECKEKNIEPKNSRISIMANQISTYVLNIINYLSKEFKTLNVVTNNICFFKNIKDRLWNENGIIITLTNNKKKALSSSNVILNIDFPEEILNKYYIYENALLIDLFEKNKINKKRFNGKIVNDFEIKLIEGSSIYDFCNQKKFENFNKKDIADLYLSNKPEEINNIII